MSWKITKKESWGAMVAAGVLLVACSKKPGAPSSIVGGNEEAAAERSAETLATAVPSQPTQARPAQEPTGRGTCVYRTFKHKPMASHQDGEACLHHKNELSFAPEAGPVNPRSVCVRVNGVPVAFQWAGSPSKPEGVVIGAVAGPRAEISFQYCTGQASCSGLCKVPRDEFLAAIGGQEEEAGQEREAVSQRKRGRGRGVASVGGGWAGADAAFGAAHVEAERELAALDQDTRGAAGSMKVFKDWVQQAVTEGCSGGK